MYIDDSGNPAGYDVDLMNMLAEDLGVELEIANLEFDAMIPGLIARQFDMVSVGLVGRPARLEQLWFTCPYVPYRQVVVVNNDSGIMSIDELNSSDVTMTAVTGSTAASLTETRFPNAELIQLDEVYERHIGPTEECPPVTSAKQRGPACLGLGSGTH